MLANMKRAFRFMDKYDLDVLVATSPENVFYFTGYDGWMTRIQKEWQIDPGSHYTRAQAYAVLCRARAHTSKSVSIVIPMYMAFHIAQNPSGIDLRNTYTYGMFPRDRDVGLRGTRPCAGQEEVNYEKIERAVDQNSSNAGLALLNVLKDKGFEKIRARIGLDMENLNPNVVKMLRKQLQLSEFRNACVLIRLVQMIKTPEEIERLRRAAVVNEKAIERLVDRIKEGVTEIQLTQIYRESVVKQGGEVEFFGIRAGSRAEGFWPPSKYKLSKGDVVLWDVGCVVNHYHADTGNVAVLGKPSRKMLALYRGSNAGIHAALETVAPGVRPSEVAESINRTRGKFGMISHGGLHGIGLYSREYPLSAPVKPQGIADDFVKPMSTDIPLEENMVINIEVPYRKVGVGAIQIEVTVRVTENGWEYLLPQERCLTIIREGKIWQRDKLFLLKKQV